MIGWREPPCTVAREAFPGTPLERWNPTLTVGAGITVGNKEIRNSDLTNQIAYSKKRNNDN